VNENLIDVAEQNATLPYTIHDVSLIKQYLNFYSKFPYDKEILGQLSVAIQGIPQSLQNELKGLNDPFENYLLELLNQVKQEASPLFDPDSINSPNSSTQGHVGSSVRNSSSSEIETIIAGEFLEQNPRIRLDSYGPSNSPNGIT
jgi:hypothetical protein